MFADDAAGVREADYPRWSWLVQDSSIFTFGVYRVTNPVAAFSQEKPHLAALASAE
jgi:hypothetical protein